MNLVYALAAPAGALSDRLDRRVLRARTGGPDPGRPHPGLADLCGASAGRHGLWGLHMGLTQGLFAAMVADAAPVRQRMAVRCVIRMTPGRTGPPVTNPKEFTVHVGMNGTPRRSARERDRAIAHLRSITLGTTVASVAAVGVFGAVAALSNSGDSSAITTAALTTARAAASTDSSSTADAIQATSASTAAPTAAATTPTTSTANAHATTGGS